MKINWGQHLNRKMSWHSCFILSSVFPCIWEKRERDYETKFFFLNKDWFESAIPDQALSLLLISLRLIWVQISPLDKEIKMSFHPGKCFGSVVRFSQSFPQMVLHLTQNNYHALHNQQRVLVVSPLTQEGEEPLYLIFSRDTVLNIKILKS